MYIILIAASLATNDHVTNYVSLNCATYTAYIFTNKIHRSRKYCTPNEEIHIESIVNTKKLLVLVLIYTSKYTTETRIGSLHT